MIRIVFQKDGKVRERIGHSNEFISHDVKAGVVADVEDEDAKKLCADGTAEEFEKWQSKNKDAATTASAGPGQQEPPGVPAELRAQAAAGKSDNPYSVDQARQPQQPKK